MGEENNLRKFFPPDEVTQIETAFVNFDQWILTIGLRYYRGEEILGMAHVIFDNPSGYRVLTEADMLNYPWPSSRTGGASCAVVEEIRSEGWLDLEMSAQNIVSSEGRREFIVLGMEYCVAVINTGFPRIIMTDMKT